jgi:hypothetical protein
MVSACRYDDDDFQHIGPHYQLRAAAIERVVADERERIAKFIETMEDGPLTTKAVKSYIADAIRRKE